MTMLLASLAAIGLLIVIIVVGFGASLIAALMSGGDPPTIMRQW